MDYREPSPVEDERLKQMSLHQTRSNSGSLPLPKRADMTSVKDSMDVLSNRPEAAKQGGLHDRHVSTQHPHPVGR